MPFVKLNQGRICDVNDKTQGKVAVQRDLAVQVHSCLKVTVQVNRVSKKAYGTHSFIKCTCGCHVTDVQDVEKTTLGIL